MLIIETEKEKRRRRLPYLPTPALHQLPFQIDTIFVPPHRIFRPPQMPLPLQSFISCIDTLRNIFLQPTAISPNSPTNGIDDLLKRMSVYSGSRTGNPLHEGLNRSNSLITPRPVRLRYGLQYPLIRDMSADSLNQLKILIEQSEMLTTPRNTP